MRSCEAAKPLIISIRWGSACETPAKTRACYCADCYASSYIGSTHGARKIGGSHGSPK